MSDKLVSALNVIQDSYRYNGWIYSLLRPYLSGVVLDIGSGLGNIASLFTAPEITEVIFSECDGKMLEALSRKTFSLPNYRTVILDVTRDGADTSLGGKKADAITCVNVLEHIEDDTGALCRIRTLLKPGGRLVMLVPALMCLYGTLDACHGHHRRYTRRTLGEKMERAGFHVEAWRYMNIFGVLTWFTAGRILKQKKFSQRHCKYLDAMVPALRRMEEGVPIPWGQSLCMVGNNP